MRISVAERELTLSRGTLFIMLVSVLMVGYGGYDYVQQTETIEDAVEVDATITSVGISEREGRGIDYYPEVRFTYRYEGESYTGDAVFPGSISSAYDSRDEARAVIEPYAENDTVTAYVDPESPRNAFLRAETSSAPLVLAGGGAVVFVLGLLKGLYSTAGDTQPRQVSERDDATDAVTTLGVDHDRLGTVCKRLIAGSFIATWLSVIGIAVVVLALGTDTSSPAASLHLDPFGPTGFVFLAAFLSVSVLVGSLIAYSGWSYLECRRLRQTRNPDEHRGFVAVLVADDETLTRYERRVQLTAASLCIGLFLLTALLDVLGLVDLPV